MINFKIQEKLKLKLLYHYVIIYNIFCNNDVINGIGCYEFTFGYLRIMTINSGKSILYSMVSYKISYA